MNQKIIIESLSMDFLRVALGLHRGSFKMAAKFKEEALKREEELESQPVNDYLRKLLKGTRKTLKSQEEGVAEDFLMYSILLQNFARHHYQSAGS